MMTMITEHEQVVLAVDIPEENIQPVMSVWSSISMTEGKPAK
jgi:hypothetical protein